MSILLILHLVGTTQIPQGRNEKPFLFVLLLLFWPPCMACGILVPRPGIEPMHPAVEVPSPNHWTAREVPEKPFNLGCLSGLGPPKIASYGIWFHQNPKCLRRGRVSGKGLGGVLHSVLAPDTVCLVCGVHTCATNSLPITLTH